MRRSLKFVGLVATVVISAIVGSAGALAFAQSHNQSVGRSGPAVVTTGGSITQVKVATDAPNATTGLTTLSQAPGMKVTISVPATYTNGALILARFSAESGCVGAPAGSWCIAEIFVDGVEAAPGDGSDYAFDTSTGASTYQWGGHSMDRSIVVKPGTHTVSVMWSVLTSGLTFWTGERSLIVERVKI
jgi:hypothetical protein